MWFPHLRDRPTVFLRLENASKVSEPLDVLLDTGASLSIFPTSLSTSLGIDLQAVVPLEISAANESRFWYRPARVTIQLANYLEGMYEVIEWEASVGFSDECPSGVFGRRDCLDYFDTTIYGHRKYARMLPNSEFQAKFPGRWLYKKHKP